MLILWYVYRAFVRWKHTDKSSSMEVATSGHKPNTEFLRSFDPTILTPAGTIRVQPTLQVPLANGKTNVYAIGDIIDWEEEKQLAKIAQHAPVVAGNILATIQNKTTPPKKYSTFMGELSPPVYAARRI